MNTKRLYVDLHVLQTVPPSCVNRDDTGSPKTAVYGGVTRARVSSQAWKHAMRQMFRDEGLLDTEQNGLRTKKLVELVAGQIRSLAPEKGEADSEAMAVKALGDAGLKVNAKGKEVDALFFISLPQAKALAELAVAGETDKKAYKEALKAAPSADMIFFGRMVAADPSLNYDAAAQVAHSISTHRAQTEYDYFTAVDDCAPEDNAGAGHLGTVEYNSATLYRYATVNLGELEEHLSQAECAAALKAFVRAFLLSMPTGKQNTFANRTLPDAVYVAIRKDQPVNLCQAFERAVPASDRGFSAPSKERLVRCAKEVYANYAAEPAAAFTLGTGLEELGQPMPIDRLLDAVTSTALSLWQEVEVQ